MFEDFERLCYNYRGVLALLICVRVLLCAAKPNKIARIKQAVMELDPKGFVIVTDAKEVFGEGFGEYTNNSL